MAQQTINIGASPNDGTGTPLRTAFQYTNSNFSELYTAVGPSGNNIVVPGNATITGVLTANGGISMANATAITSSGAVAFYVDTNQLVLRARATNGILFQESTGVNNLLTISNAGVFGFLDGAGGTRMTLNATGLGVGLNPSSYVGRLVVGGTPAATSGAVVYVRDTFANGSNNSLGSIMFASSPGTDFYVGKKVSSAVSWFSIGNANSGAEYFQIDSSGNVGIGVTPSYKLDTYTTLQGTVTTKQFANRTSNKILVKRFFGITADTALFSVECGTAGAGAMAAFEINVFATGQKSGVSSDRQFYGKWYVTRNLAGTFTITSAFSSGSSGAFTVAASGTSLNVNGIFSVISDGSACVEVTGYIGGRDTVIETALNVTMP